MTTSDLVKYRIERSLESLDEAKILAREKHWNSTANRLYYSCFYLVNALLLKNGVNYSTHNGVKTEFHRQFIKTSVVSITSGKTYNRLFNLRQEGDYLDFKRLEEDDVNSFFSEVEDFINEIIHLINL